jgi:hypothetical protein
MASPLNPAVVHTVTYEYLFCLPSSDWLQPSTRQEDRGLLTGSCTLGYRESLVTTQKSGYDRFPLAANV